MTTSGNGIYSGWWMVAASFVCLIVGVGPVVGISFGVFMVPMADEFGWSRGEAARGVAAGLLGFTLAQPVIGRLVSRRGARAVILGSATGFGVCLFTMSVVVVDLTSFCTAALVTGCIAGGTSPLPYGAVLSRWFTRRRGMALSIALAGIGAGTMLLPPLVAAMITSLGWRAGFVMLGVLVTGIVLPVAGMVLRNAPEEAEIRAEDRAACRGEAAAGVRRGPGFTPAAAIRTSTFWLVAAALTMNTGALQGCVVHLPALLTDRGYSVMEAASTVSALAFGFLPGLLGSGLLVDRMRATRVAASFAILASLGFLVLAAGNHSLTMLAVVLIGAAVGATVHLIPALALALFGEHRFAEIYGLLMGAFGVGTVLGPAVAGALFDHTGTYSGMPEIAMSLALCAAVLQTLAGRNERHAAARRVAPGKPP